MTYSISTCDFSTLPPGDDLIDNQIFGLVERTFKREEVLYLAFNAEHL